MVEIPFKVYFTPEPTLWAMFRLSRRRSTSIAPSAASKLAYVNPYASFEASGPLENYYPRDQHLNRFGHATLARVLVRALRKGGLLDRPGPARSQRSLSGDSLPQ